MVMVRFLKADGITIDGIARGFSLGDERDYLPEEIVKQKLALGIIEMVKKVNDKPEDESKTESEKKAPKVTYKKKQLKTERQDKRLDSYDNDNKDDTIPLIK